MEETRKSSQGVHVWLPARQVLVRAKPNALASRSCHFDVRNSPSIYLCGNKWMRKSISTITPGYN